jgi:hypothetical protein
VEFEDLDGIVQHIGPAHLAVEEGPKAERNGLKVGDEVRHLNTGAVGTVVSFHAEERGKGDMVVSWTEGFGLKGLKVPTLQRNVRLSRRGLVVGDTVASDGIGTGIVERILPEDNVGGDVLIAWQIGPIAGITAAHNSDRCKRIR